MGFPIIRSIVFRVYNGVPLFGNLPNRVVTSQRLALENWRPWSGEVSKVDFALGTDPTHFVKSRRRNSVITRPTNCNIPQKIDFFGAASFTLLLIDSI